MGGPLPRTGELCSLSLRAEYLLKLLGILPHGNFVSSSFVNIINHLFISVWVFVLYFDYNPILLYFCGSNCFSSGHSELFELNMVSLWIFQFGGDSFLCVCTSLFSSASRCSKLIFHISFPSPSFSATSPTNSGSFSWGMVLETSISFQCAHCYWRIIYFRTFQLTEQRNKRVNTHLCIYTLYDHLCIKVNTSESWWTLFYYHMDHSSLLPLLLCKLPHQEWEIWSQHWPLTWLFIFSIHV